MKKMIFIDIDGTLRDSKKQISKENIDSIKLAENNEYDIVLCSGRSRKHCIEVSKSIGASKYIINSNGAEGYDYINGKVVYQNLFTKQDILEIWDFAKENDLGIVFNSDNINYVTVQYPGYNEGDCLIKDIEEVLDKKIVQVILGNPNFEYMLDMKNKIEKFENLEIANLSKALVQKKKIEGKNYFYDIVKKGTCKGNGIEDFCNKLNVDLSDCIAIGDSKNDLSMFNKVGMSVAMGNATDDVKAKANFITKTNDENGVAEFLNMIINEW